MAHDYLTGGGWDGEGLMIDDGDQIGVPKGGPRCKILTFRCSM